MWEVFFTEEASSDVEEIRDYYEESRDGLGGEFLDSARVAIDRLQRAPLAIGQYYRDLRRVFIGGRFPYKIFYLVEIDDERVVIVRVLHSRRDHRRLLG